MLRRHQCFLLFLAIYALVNVLCDESISDESLRDLNPTKITNSEQTIESLQKLTENAVEHSFSAQVPLVMKLIVNSVYSNKEVFLRELISNSYDANEKSYLHSLKHPDATSSPLDLSIMIKPNPQEKTISIRDTGIGMTKEELIKNLGTIAKSGTSELLSKLAENNDSVPTDLIGQFGVGFYSAFLVADRVTVISKHDDDSQYVWESDSVTFKIAKDPRGNTLTRGTEVILHLKDEAKEYLQNDVLQKIIKKYSQFVRFPIKLWESRTENVVEDAEDESADIPSDVSVEEEKPKTEKKTVEKTVWDWVQLNDLKPLWLKKPSEVSDEEYNELFKVLSHSRESPLAHIHFSAEGEVSFSAVLFISPTPRPDLFQSDKLITDNVKLYVRRVFISDSESLLPRYLSFIYGIVDSDDFPLNVSREMLQQHKLLMLIKKKLTRKAIAMIENLSDEDFDKFWKAYAIAIKLGILHDTPNKTRLTKLMRFYTSKSEGNLTSFAQYVSRMQENQDQIYFAVGQNIDEVKNLPFMERLKHLGLEVIYFTEPMDEYVMQSLHEVMEKKTQNVAKAGLNFKGTEKSKENFEELEKQFKPLTDWLKDKCLSGKIKDAKVSHLLEASPCALVADEYSVSGNFQKVIMAQAYAQSDSSMNSYYLNQKHTLEINPRHPLIRKLNEIIQNDPNDEYAKETGLTLFDISVLRSGFMMQNVKDFTQRIERGLCKHLDVDLDEPVEFYKYDSNEEGNKAENVVETDSADVKEEL